MSFKAFAVKDGENHWVLPKTHGMKVEAHAFFSEELFRLSEEGMWRQLAQAASYEGVIGAYAMPDAHVGFGVPVGTVIVTDETILQAGSGYDISCGVVYLHAKDLDAEKVASWEAREKWVKEVDLRVATGVGSRRPPKMKKFQDRDVEKILRYGAKAIGVSADVCERQFIPIPETADLRSIARARDKVLPQLGSVGGGNHFIEMQVDRDSGEVWIMVHCGSRGYGWQTANHFFFEGAALRKIPKGRREESFLYASEPLGKEYWAHHNSAANFAVANRHIIAEGVNDALEAVFGVRAEVYFEISHNLVQEESLVLPDGTTKRGFVHRKGATRAFPAGHPDLIGTKWETTGHPCLIPGSMIDGAAILFPLAGASKSGFSVNHGSGRVMARGEAKRRLEARHDEIDREMKDITRVFRREPKLAGPHGGSEATDEGMLGGTQIRGIVGNTKRTPLDECGHVYKKLDDVLEVLEANGIARVEHRMFPVANLKGTD